MIQPQVDEHTADAETTISTVSMIRILSVPPETVWPALTDPAVVACWFGDLSAPLQPDTPVRLDFGDGDFFTIEPTELDPPSCLQYRWRFLGIGPVNTITWRVVDTGGSAILTVTDEEPGRAREVAYQMREGWQDFTYRLDAFLKTGNSMRYDWRRSFDGSIELHVPATGLEHALFTPGAQAQWLPFGGESLVAGTSVTLPDNADPARVQLSNITWTSPTSVGFDLTHPGWLQPTTCQIMCVPHGSTTLLVVQHGGWESISENDETQRAQRKRFCELWIAALQRAQLLAPG